MKKEEIDKWVEDHVKGRCAEASTAIKWGKIVAQKFYELGRRSIVKHIELM